MRFLQKKQGVFRYGFLSHAFTRTTMKKLNLAILVILVLSGIFPLENPRLRLQAQALLHRPMPEAWRMLSDLSLAYQYWPEALKTHIHGSLNTGEGATRVTSFDNGWELEETATEWDDHTGYVLAWSASSTLWSFHDVELRYHLEGNDEQGTKSDLAITMTLRPNFGLLGQWLLTQYLADTWQAQLDQLVDNISNLNR